MSTDHARRADAPVSKFDFVNGQGRQTLSSDQPQPTNHALALQKSIAVGTAVMVGSRHLVTEALMNPEVFASSDLVEQGNSRPLIPLGIDPPDHTRYRRLLDPLFSPRRMEAREADIADRVNHFIDGFIARGTCDFTAEFAEMFPSSVFLGLMGLPWEQLDTLVRMRDGLLHPGTADMTNEQRSDIQRRTAQEVYRYFDAILDERAAQPRDDVLSALVGPQPDGSLLSRDEVLGICFVLLTAGLDTVTDSLTCFWAYLARHPEQQRRIVADPDVIPRAVEELLRWETPVPFVVRWARQRSDLGEHTIDAGRPPLRFVPDLALAWPA